MNTFTLAIAALATGITVAGRVLAQVPGSSGPRASAPAVTDSITGKPLPAARR